SHNIPNKTEKCCQCPQAQVSVNDQITAIYQQQHNANIADKFHHRKILCPYTGCREIILTVVIIAGRTTSDFKDLFRQGFYCIHITAVLLYECVRSAE